MKKILRIGVWLVGINFGVLIALSIAGYLTMRASLPLLDSDVRAAGFQSAVTVTRDDQGSVSIAATNTLDAMRALGFIHAQERFFEMDLARRSAAGELSALLGEATIKTDKEKRQHRFRARMTAQWQKISSEDQTWISVYTEGVNAGLEALDARPWQYLVLRAKPEPWREVDSLLVISEMYFMLQSRGIAERFDDAILRRKIGDALFDWLKPTGGEWDAALDGSVIVTPPLPSTAMLNVRRDEASIQNALTAPARADAASEIGSNNWVVGGALSSHGGAILADDMHLGLGVPNIWFRAQFSIGEGSAKQSIVGATLPGVPGLSVGSNGSVAWGFTNGYGQWFDWVEIEQGSALAMAVTSVREIIAVKGAQPTELDVRETAFGPILRTSGKTDYALSWALYRDGAVNARATGMMFARTIDEAILIAHTSGIPHQNVLIADKSGNIAWTIMGRIPAYPAGAQTRRGTFTTADELPTTWLAPEKYPLIKNPPDARLWTANNRQLGGVGGSIIGDGGFDLGARASQIRDRLREQEKFDEKKLYAIQLDNESRFLKRWAALALATAAAKPDEKNSAIAKELKIWNGRADIDQTGHRIARAFRQQVMDKLWLSWITATDRASPGPDTPEKRFRVFAVDAKFEYPVWQALSVRPAHLVPKPYRDWNDFLAAQLASTYDDLTKQNATLSDARWGKRNTTNIRHPFTHAMPFLSDWLNMPKAPQAGDNHMPLVATPTFGASQRMVVAPGREEQGIFVMPGGQSGHPLSPFYGAGHSDWLTGKPGSLLAGETKHTLRLIP